MNITEQFAQLLKKEQKNEVISFLKALNAEQKKELLPDLKKLEKEYNEPVNAGFSSYRIKGTQPQFGIIAVAAFVCYSQKDFEKGYHGARTDAITFDNILTWHCPKWFGSYINDHANHDYLPPFLTYDWYLEKEEQGYLSTIPALIAKLLPLSIVVRRQMDCEFVTDNLLKRTITLQEHIWFVFAYDNSIHWSGRYHNKTGLTEADVWIETLHKFSSEGLIDRQRLVKEAIAAANKGFNQNLSGWFINLLIALKPSAPELIAVQRGLMAVFNSSFTKPANTALQYFKEIATEDDFDVHAFIDHSSLILTSTSKSTVTSTLMIMEKLAKKHVDMREAICVAASQALIHQDSTLQLRAAKLIQKYGDTAAEVLTATISEYRDTLLSDTSILLQPFFPVQEAEAPVSEEERIIKSVATTQKISVPKTFEEFIFLASQAFDQNEAYHFDLLPAVVLQFQDQLTTALLDKLMPAFQRAYKIKGSDWTSTKGITDDLLADFFISWGQLITPSASLDTTALQAMHRSYHDQEMEKKAKWVNYVMQLAGIKTWNITTRCYEIPKRLLLTAIWLLENKIALPLLSTPTHEPCTVAANTLTDRLASYAAANVKPGNIDLQVAIARCFAVDKEAAIAYAEQRLTGEYCTLMKFMLGEDYKPADRSAIKTAWLVAALTRRQLPANNWYADLTQLPEHFIKADFKWATAAEPYMRCDYNYETRKAEEIPDVHKTLRIDFGSYQKKLPALKNLFNKILSPKTEEEKSIYSFMQLNISSVFAEANDIRRLLFLNPNQPDHLLAQVINKSLIYPDFWEAGDKKIVINALDALLSLPHLSGKMTHLFIATCMIAGDKTVRSYAAEIWVKAVTENTMDSALLGEIIGTHEIVEYAPLKRFTDLIQSNMIRISTRHNRALETLLTAYIANSAEQPINNTKKLIEILNEVIVLNKSVVSDEAAKARLGSWKEVASLKKVIEKVAVG